MRKCKSRYKCFKCHEKHNTAICERDTPVRSVPPTNDEENNTNLTCVTNTDGNNVTLLKTAIATASDVSGNCNQKGRLLFDDASTKSYITKEFCERLKLKPISRRRLIIRGACATSTVTDCDIVQFKVQTLEPQIQIYVTASVLEEICQPLDDQRITLAKSSYPHLRSISLADTSNDETSKKIDILIGGDFYYEFQTGVTKAQPVGRGPVGFLTKIGWVIGGPVLISQPSSHVSSNVTTALTLKCTQNPASVKDPLMEKVNYFFDIESLGIRDNGTSEYGDFKESLEFNDVEKRYLVRLPWKDGYYTLPDNYSNSERRLFSNIKKLRKDTNLLKQYDETINNQLQQGVIEICNDEQSVNEPIHYLPHRGIVRNDKPSTKLRIVYDASSKVAKHLPSLNECLLKGPSLNPLIIQVLMRFRLHQVAFICDIEKAFLQIGIHEADRDAVRFLWVSDPFSDDMKIVIYRFTRVLFGLTSSPFLLNGTLREHLMKYVSKYPVIMDLLIRSFYVDDFAGGGCNKTDVYKKFKILVNILSDASFKVHKFLSNDISLNCQYSDANYTNDGDLVNDSCKVLGIKWYFQRDFISIDLRNIIERTDNVTKRTVLSILAKIFDPLGFVSPVTLRAKLIFQELCKRDVKWDQSLPSDIMNLWLRWEKDLINSGCFEIRRCYFSSHRTKAMLIGFCDGSTKAYAAVIYLRYQLENEKYDTMLVVSKSRVAPLEKPNSSRYTVPRLELLGCLILSRLMETVRNALKSDIDILQSRYYTDSTINLYRIKGLNKEFKQFVRNRLQEIRSKSRIEDWYYVPTNLNPSDLPTRGCLLSELNTNNQWIFGPEFLRKPNILEFRYSDDVIETELKSSVLTTCEIPVNKNKTIGMLPAEYFRDVNIKPNLASVIDLSKFGDFQKLIGATSYVYRFMNRSDVRTSLSAEEVTRSKTEWIASEQRREARENGANFEKTGINLCFVLEDNLIRCKGRISNADLPYDTRFPIYLPSNSPLTKLIIKEAHERVFHQKVAATLTQLRAEYWIPRGRQIVKTVISTCLLCRLYDTMPYSPTPPPDLPKVRVGFSPPFSNLGTDHMGPLYVREIYTPDKLHKCYIALFSCCVTRMVHLELQPNLEASTTIRAMKRTFARVGTPKVIISDNHKTYRSASVRAFANRNSIKWNYILPLSPHWGGFYERMNVMIKNALRRSLKKAKLTYEELETVVTEIESVLNSRPLSYIAGDDVAEPLTPSHLMYGRRLISPVNYQDDSSQTISPTKRLTYIGSLINNFWKTFNEVYLTSLRERVRKGTKHISVHEGDVVLIKDKFTPRNGWKMGRITRVINAPDGTRKGAELKTIDGIYKRPLNLSCSLELDEKPGNMLENNVNIPPTDTPADVNQPDKRGRRTAAITGEQIRRINEGVNL